MMTRRHKTPTCTYQNCSELPYLGGLCELHNAEHNAAERRRADARQALNEFTVDGVVFNHGPLREEMERLRQRWFDSCNAINHKRSSKMPLDEAEYALSWCTTLAQELVDAERRSRKGEVSDSNELEYARIWVWERFKNLDAGLMSNGVARPVDGL